jgi:hypothetical protein
LREPPLRRVRLATVSLKVERDKFPAFSSRAVVFAMRSAEPRVRVPPELMLSSVAAVVPLSATFPVTLTVPAPRAAATTPPLRP